VLCLLTLTGCTGAISHQEAGQTAVGGVALGAASYGFGRLFAHADSGLSRVAHAFCVITALASLVWAACGVENLLVREPTPPAGAYRCAVDADHDIEVTVQNQGQMVLMVGSMMIQPEDAQGRPMGPPIKAFLPAILKMPKHVAPGEVRTFDVGPMTAPGQPHPAQCKVTDPSIKGGPGRGSIVSFW
jgi:hypothetical protein